MIHLDLFHLHVYKYAVTMNPIWICKEAGELVFVKAMPMLHFCGHGFEENEDLSGN